MYPLVLFIHSWLRWIVVLASVYVVLRVSLGLIRKRPWTPREEKASYALVSLVNVQFMLGLALYVWLSPMVRSAFADMKAAMRSAPLRFFAIEHITAMVLAVALLHMGYARMRRAQNDGKRYRSMLFGSAGFLFLVCAGMPWPMLAHGRPLARMHAFPPETEQPVAEAPQLYGTRCAACHGPSGHGDGLAAAAMQPRPRDFADREWQKTVADADLRAVIRQGGLARQLSTSMPSHPDLRDEQIAELVRFIRNVPERVH